MSFEGNKFNKGLSQYSTNEVIEFAKQLGLDNYSKKIEELQIDGYDLSIINDNLIKSLEILNPHDLIKKKYSFKINSTTSNWFFLFRTYLSITIRLYSRFNSR